AKPSEDSTAKWGFTQPHTAARSELALVLVRIKHVASLIVTANHSIMRTTAKLGVVDCIADRVRLIRLAVKFRATATRSREHRCENTMHDIRADHQSRSRPAGCVHLGELYPAR